MERPGKRLATIVSALAISGVAVIWAYAPKNSGCTVLRDQVIDVDGVRRRYRLVVPDAISSVPVPVVFAFHGAGGSGEGFARTSSLDELAAAKRFYLVYLEGRHASWPPSMPPENPDVMLPDLRFFDRVLEDLCARCAIDERRVYAVGMSQGAAFVNVLVAKRSERLAAAAAHSGWLPKPLPEDGIKAVRKCPILQIAGAEDTQVPPRVVRAAADCFAAEGHTVEFALISGLGHGWGSRDDINEVIWRFFASHELPRGKSLLPDDHRRDSSHARGPQMVARFGAGRGRVDRSGFAGLNTLPGFIRLWGSSDDFICCMTW